MGVGAKDRGEVREGDRRRVVPRDPDRGVDVVALGLLLLLLSLWTWVRGGLSGGRRRERGGRARGTGSRHLAGRGEPRETRARGGGSRAAHLPNRVRSRLRAIGIRRFGRVVQHRVRRRVARFLRLLPGRRTTRVSVVVARGQRHGRPGQTRGALHGSPNAGTRRARARTRSSLDARDVVEGLAPGRSARRGRRASVDRNRQRLIFQLTQHADESSLPTTTDGIRHIRLALPPRSPSHHLPPGTTSPSSSFHAAYSFPAISPVTE